MNGQGDAMGGAILGGAEAIEEIRRKILIKTGGVISPFNAWMIIRGLTTLSIRMREHEHNAIEVAQMLENHPAVKKDRKSTRLNSSHVAISYAVFCFKKK